MNLSASRISALAVALASAALAVPASAVTPPPAELLPDLVQKTPEGLRLAGSGGTWRLAFSSTVRNDGAGPFRIEGHGGGAIDVPMVADQVVSLDDGTTTTYPAVGELHYVQGFGHEHWHIMRLESYQLISVADPGNVVTDKKTGFCLVAGYPNGSCAQNAPTATSLVEGLLPGQQDLYTAFVEYQELAITQATTPEGEYHLVHRANPDENFHEATLSNNAASLLLDIRWPADGGAPAITCPALTNGQCPEASSPPGSGSGPPPPADPPADPPVEPQEQPLEQPLEQPPEQPQPVPVIQDPVAVTTAAATASMTRAQAIDLARRVARDTSKRKGKAIAATCSRRSQSAFSCRVGWTQSGARWRGLVSVGYRLAGAKLEWVYHLDVANSQTGRRLHRSSVRGSSNVPTLRAGAASMLCAAPGSAPRA